MADHQDDILQYQYSLLSWMQRIVLERVGMCDFLLDVIESMDRIEEVGMSVTDKDMQTYLKNLSSIQQA